MIYKVALFDLDGTLVYTEPKHRYLLVGKILRTLGVSSDKRYIDMFWFETKRNDIIREYFKVDPVLFWATFKKFDNIRLRERYTKPYEDVRFLRELKNNGTKTGLITGAPPHIATLEIGLLGFEFDAMVIAHTSNGIKPKPHPHGIEECLSILSMNKEDAVYIGNAEEDVLTAKAAGVMDIMMERGDYHFPNVEPSIRINSLFALRPYFGLIKS